MSFSGWVGMRQQGRAQNFSLAGTTELSKAESGVVFWEGDSNLFSPARGSG